MTFCIPFSTLFEKIKSIQPCREMIALLSPIVKTTVCSRYLSCLLSPVTECLSLPTTLCLFSLLKVNKVFWNQNVINQLEKQHTYTIHIINIYIYTDH